MMYLLTATDASKYLDSRQIYGIALADKIVAGGLFLPNLGMHDIPRRVYR